MREKTQTERYAAALIMLTSKAAEGCTSCLEGYKRMAIKAGVSQKDIDFAIAQGTRSQRQLLTRMPNDNTNMLSLHKDASIEIVAGKEVDSFFDDVFTNADVQILDTHFRSLGYKLLSTHRGMAKLKMADRICTQGYFPYQLDDRHFSWIDYHIGQAGVDLIGVTADLTHMDTTEDSLPTIESFIVQQGQVTPGHACNTNSFWNCLLTCCGPSGVGCITAGPGWWACAVTVCGVCATVCCFQAGCC
jgi:hypothetical protein